MGALQARLAISGRRAVLPKASPGEPSGMLMPELIEER